MDQRIVYKGADGGVIVITPADCGMTVDQIAKKDVPAGSPYAIVLATDFPDRSQRAAWTVNAADLTAGIGG